MTTGGAGQSLGPIRQAEGAWLSRGFYQPDVGAAKRFAQPLDPEKRRIVSGPQGG